MGLQVQDPSLVRNVGIGCPLPPRHWLLLRHIFVSKVVSLQEFTLSWAISRWMRAHLVSSFHWSVSGILLDTHHSSSSNSTAEAFPITELIGRKNGVCTIRGKSRSSMISSYGGKEMKETQLRQKLLVNLVNISSRREKKFLHKQKKFHVSQRFHNKLTILSQSTFQHMRNSWV